MSNETHELALPVVELASVDVGAVGYAGLLGGGDELVLGRAERGGCRREGGGIVLVRRGDLIAVQLVDLLDCGEHGVPVRLRGRRCAERLQAAQPRVEGRGDLLCEPGRDLGELRCVGVGRIEAGHREGLPVVLVLERRLADREGLARELVADPGGLLVRVAAAAGKKQDGRARRGQATDPRTPPTPSFRVSTVLQGNHRFLLVGASWDADRDGACRTRRMRAGRPRGYERGASPCQGALSRQCPDPRH